MNRGRPVAALLALTATGCATAYVPPDDGRVRLVIDAGELAVRRDGEVRTISQEMTGLFECDEQARQLAAAAFDDLSSARGYAVGGILLTPVFGIGIPLVYVGIRRQQRGTATVIDAMNRANDSPRCLKAGR